MTTTARKRVAVFPGSFDPITRGHEDVVRRALRFSDGVIVAVSHRSSEAKQHLFSVAERLDMIGEIFADTPEVEVAEFDGLLVDFARQRRATLIVRGLRGALDLEYELKMALTNRELNGEIETVFLAPTAELSFLSSSLVREVVSHGGDASRFVGAPVLRRILGRLPLDG